jgi:hypothetical protein
MRSKGATAVRYTMITATSGAALSTQTRASIELWRRGYRVGVYTA